MNNQHHLQPGAISSRPPGGLWKVYILQPQGFRWKCVGSAAERPLAESHMASLKRVMPGRQFCVAWNSIEGDN